MVISKANTTAKEDKMIKPPPPPYPGFSNSRSKRPVLADTQETDNE